MIRNEKVTLPEDNKRHLDMEDIVKAVEKQYADLAARAREEAEIWNQKKVQKENEGFSYRVQVNVITEFHLPPSDGRHGLQCFTGGAKPARCKEGDL